MFFVLDGWDDERLTGWGEDERCEKVGVYPQSKPGGER